MCQAEGLCPRRLVCRKTPREPERESPNNLCRPQAVATARAIAYLLENFLPYNQRGLFDRNDGADQRRLAAIVAVPDFGNSDFQNFADRLAPIGDALRRL